MYDQNDSVFGTCPICRQGDDSTRLRKRRANPSYVRCETCRRKEYISVCLRCSAAGDARPKRSYRRTRGGILCESHGCQE